MGWRSSSVPKSRGAQFKASSFGQSLLWRNKRKQGPCWERKQAVIYRGPWRKVIDDDGHVLERGKRTAVCDKTFQIYNREPYAQDILPIEPYETISLKQAGGFDCGRSPVRDPRQTQGVDHDVTKFS